MPQTAAAGGHDKLAHDASATRAAAHMLIQRDTSPLSRSPPVGAIASYFDQ